MSYFKDWLFNKLPNYYHISDSYKNTAGKGLLQRYLENIGEDIDDNILPFIDNILDLIDPTKQNNTDYKFLNTLAYTVGSPPDIFLGDTAQAEKYAKLIHHIVSIYRIKGTKKSFVSFFALLGYTVSVIEWPQPDPFLLDNGDKLDDDNELDNWCLPCSEFSILSQAVLNTGICGDTGNPVLDPELYGIMIEIIKSLQPINTILRSIISGGVICEEVSFCYQDEITFNFYVYDGFLDDPAYIFDSTNTFDQKTLDSTSSVDELC